MVEDKNLQKKNHKRGLEYFIIIFSHFRFCRCILFFPETKKAASGELCGIFRISYNYRPTTPRAASLVQPSDVYDPLAVVLHGDKRGVQSVTWQFHDGATTWNRVHPNGPATGFEPYHGGQSAVVAHNECDDSYHPNIEDIYGTIAAASSHQLRTCHRSTGSETGYSPVRS